MLLAAVLGAGACASGQAEPAGPSAPVVVASPTPPPAPSPDDVAGVLARDVPQRGTGELLTVPGSAPAPGAGRVVTVRVEVEGELPVDGASFAGFVMTTLNDGRGWGGDGAVTFARTDGDAALQVVLASPDTSAELCLPLDTGGTLSCRTGPQVVITHHRWVHGHPDYADDLTGYRQYVVNHEVGHFLGHRHVDCPGAGLPAPVMQQQTFGLDGCAPNPWPQTA